MAFLKRQKSLTPSCWIPSQVILTFYAQRIFLVLAVGRLSHCRPRTGRELGNHGVAFWQSRGGFAINLSARSPLGAVHTPRVLDPLLSVATVLPPYHRLTTAAVKIPVGAKGCQGSRVSRPFFNRIKIFPRWTMDGPSPPPPPAWVNIYFSQIREEQEGNPLWQQKWDSVGCLFVIFQPATQDEPTITFNAKNGKLELKKSWPPPSPCWMTLDSANKPTPSHHDRLCALPRDFLHKIFSRHNFKR